MKWITTPSRNLRPGHPLAFFWSAPELPIFALLEDQELWNLTPVAHTENPEQDLPVAVLEKGDLDTPSVWETIKRFTRFSPLDLSRYAVEKKGAFSLEAAMRGAGMSVNHRSIADMKDMGEKNKDSLDFAKLYDLPFSTVRQFDRLDASIRRRVSNLVNLVLPGKNQIRELTSHLYDLEQKERLSFLEYAEQRVQKMNPDGIKQTREEIFHRLHTIRYPRLKSFTDKQKKLKTALNLPNNISIQTTDDFEGGGISVHIRLEKDSDLQTGLDSLQDKKNQEILNQIIELHREVFILP